MVAEFSPLAAVQAALRRVLAGDVSFGTLVLIVCLFALACDLGRLAALAVGLHLLAHCVVLPFVLAHVLGTAATRLIGKLAICMKLLLFAQQLDDASFPDLRTIRRLEFTRLLQVPAQV